MKKALLLAFAAIIASFAFASTASAACVAPYCPAPSATTGAAGSVTTTGAALSGTVNPNLGGDATWTIQLGTDSTSFPTVVATGVAADGSGDVAVAGTASGLTPSTTYFFRVVASSAGGTVTGAVGSFMTAAVTPPPPVGPAPTAITAPLAPTATLTSTSADLAGVVNPKNGGAITWQIKLGTSASDLSTVVNSGSAPNGTANVPVTGTASGLTADTTYYYAVVATGPGGTATGTPQSFTTAAGTPPPPTNKQTDQITSLAQDIFGTNDVAVTKAFDLGNGIVVVVSKSANSTTVAVNGKTITFSSAALSSGAAQNLFLFGSPTVDQQVTISKILSYIAGTSSRSASAAASKSVTVPLPKQKLTIKKGHSKPATIKLTKSALASLKKGHNVKVKITITTKDSLGNVHSGTVTYTIKGAKVKKAKKKAHRRPVFTG